MTIHRQTFTLTVFSSGPIDSSVLEDNFKEAIRHHNAVVDVEQEGTAILTDSAGQLELWDRGFDADVLDEYNRQEDCYIPSWAVDILLDEREARGF